MNRVSHGGTNSPRQHPSALTNPSGTHDDRAHAATGAGASSGGGSPDLGLPGNDGYSTEICGELVPLICGLVCTVGGLIGGVVWAVTAAASPTNTTASPAATPDAVAALALGAALTALGLL